VAQFQSGLTRKAALKVLLLTQVLPYPPDSGPKVKTLNVIKYLAMQHEVTLVSFVRGDQSEEVRALRSFCHSVHTIPIKRKAVEDLLYLAKSLLNRQPFLMVRDDRPEMRAIIDKLASSEHFDIVHADQLNMTQYALQVPAAQRVLDTHNALWLLYKRLSETMPPGLKKWILERDWQLLKRYEGDMLRKFDTILAVSQEDKAALDEAAGDDVGIVIIPITVDTEDVRAVVRRSGANRIVHIGTMYWPPNVDGVLWFIEKIFPEIRARRADIVFDVIGAQPPQELIALSGENSGINVTGYLEDPTHYLQNAGVMVVPLRAGGGMRVKILNALAQGLPIVSTSIGAEGIPVENGKHLLIADQPQEFAQAVLRLLEDPNLSHELGRQGRQFIQERFDYRAACQPLDEIYKRVKETV
jgi:polysaccharide biosynthesis protein PslH